MAKKIGRPRKDTGDNVTVILRALEGGATRKVACSAAGVSTSAFQGWLGANPDFALAVEQAEAAFSKKAISGILHHPASALKLLMMMRRSDEQLQPIQEKVAVDLSGDVAVHWSDEHNAPPATSQPDDSTG